MCQTLKVMPEELTITSFADKISYACQSTAEHAELEIKTSWVLLSTLFLCQSSPSALPAVPELLSCCTKWPGSITLPEEHEVLTGRKIFFFCWNRSLKNIFWNKCKERTHNARKRPYWGCRFCSCFVPVMPEILVLLFVVNYISPLSWLFLLNSCYLFFLTLLIIFPPLHKMF